MGTSINCWAEVKKGDKWEIVNDEIFPEYMSKTEFSCACFSLRNYRVYAFLAGVRNDYGSHVLVMPREFPQDSEFLHEKMPWGRTRQEDLENDYDAHGKSYLMLRELLEFKYDDEYIYDPHRWAVPADMFVELERKDIYETMEEFFRYCNVKEFPNITKTLLL